MHNNNINDVYFDQNENNVLDDESSPILKNKLVMPDTEEKMVLSTSDYTSDNSPFIENLKQYGDNQGSQVQLDCKKLKDSD